MAGEPHTCVRYPRLELGRGRTCVAPSGRLPAPQTGDTALCEGDRCLVSGLNHARVGHARPPLAPLSSLADTLGSRAPNTEDAQACHLGTPLDKRRELP